MFRTLTVTAMSGVLAVAVLGARRGAQQPPPASQPPPPGSQQPTDITTTITSEGGSIPRLAIPDFIAIGAEPDVVAAAKTLGQVLWDDLNFEHEFAFIPRDTYASIPRATSFADVPFNRWRELNADGLVVGTVQKTASGIRVEMRLYNSRTRQSAYGREYISTNPRLVAHTMADELHASQRALRGVARTKLTFDSDRDGERMSGTVEKRDNKEVYISDYDGENQTRVTVGRTLNIFPRWSPDGRSIAYTSYRRGGANIFISNIYQATLDEVTKGPDESWLAAWSPDGGRLCFASSREGNGNTNLFIVNRDGSGLRRLTNHPSINTSPTWSPSGTQIAFTSDRTGAPQIYVMSVDGLGQPQRITAGEGYADKPTWSPAPYNEIAYTARAGVNDIKVIDMATREVRQLTFGEGNNESAVFSPNGRHLAFTSTRTGKKQIFTIARTGKDVKQITRSGNNEHPDWSRGPQ
ncbi:MAG: PD40 domain-containing protein [Acidobacteria bacterium]|nr:PD40 domain-containing protein [Acidobacteriota bacterium]